MKNIFIALMAFIAIGLNSNCQSIKVPDAVQKAFAAKFPQATSVKWGKESAKEYEAEFKLNNTDVSSNFSSDGSWVVTETGITAADLPTEVSKAVMTKYPGATIDGAEKVEKPGSNPTYEVAIKIKNKKKEVVLTHDGKFTK